MVTVAAMWPLVATVRMATASLVAASVLVAVLPGWSVVVHWVALKRNSRRPHESVVVAMGRLKRNPQ